MRPAFSRSDLLKAVEREFVRFDFDFCGFLRRRRAVIPLYSLSPFVKKGHERDDRRRSVPKALSEITILR